MKYYPKKHEDTLAYRIAANYVEFLEQCSNDPSICRMPNGDDGFPASIDRYLDRDNFVLSSHVYGFEHRQWGGEDGVAISATGERRIKGLVKQHVRVLVGIALKRGTIDPATYNRWQWRSWRQHG